MGEFLGEELVTDLAGTPYEGFTRRRWALELIGGAGGIDGAHHKSWVLDQVVRVLLGTPVVVKLASWASEEEGQEGTSEYRFDTGEPTGAYVAWVADRDDGMTASAPSPNGPAEELALALIAENDQPDVDIVAEMQAAKSQDDITALNRRLHGLDQHNRWMLDQVARILLGTPVVSVAPIVTGEPSALYLTWVEAAQEIDEDGEPMYSYESGEPLPKEKRRRGPHYAGITP